MALTTVASSAGAGTGPIDPGPFQRRPVETGEEIVAALLQTLITFR
jgi:hypothetical protein